MNQKLSHLTVFFLGAAAAIIIMQLWSAQTPDAPQSVNQQNAEDDQPKPEPDLVSEETVAEVAFIPEPVTGESGEVSEPEVLQPDPFDALMNKVFSGQATPDEQLAFWEMVQNSDRINEIIKAAENSVANNPQDIDARMSLAELYQAKLLSVPGGPARGLWAMKAEEQFKGVLQINPNHWDAQSRLAFSYSMYPDFMNKTGAAIAEYEKLIAIQDAMEPDRKFIQSFRQLTNLYLKKGDPAGALRTVEKGLEQYPNNKQLQEELQSLHNQYVFE